jgi:hypothetical protein
LLVQAVQASLLAGDVRAAIAAAERAARLAPRSIEAQLVAKSLAHRTRPALTADQARVTLADLRAADAPADAAQRELLAFLLAEALDAAVGPEAALRELRDAEQQVGLRPLVALGLAERQALGGDLEQALAYFDAALSGDLQQLRTRGAVALAAASVAKDAGQLERALSYVEMAAAEPEQHARAVALQEELRHGIARAPAPAPAAAPAPAPAKAKPAGELRKITGIGAAFTDALESALLEDLAAGSVQAGRALVERLEMQPARANDFVAVARRLVMLVPGEVWALSKLHQAALADRNLMYGRALSHALAVCAGGREREAPPLISEQPEDPERLRALLFRDVTPKVCDALALIWDGAEHVFRRDPTTYGVTGLERVPLASPTPLGQAYAAAARVFGLARTPLFQRRSSANVTVTVALLSPPAVIVSGDVRQDSAELKFHLAAMLAAAMPERALLFGTSESQARAVLEALGLAFGPPQKNNRATLGSALHLAEVLWESIPMRAQRRLRELCDDPKALDFNAAMEASRRALRRAGLFACGDLGVALRETCLDEGQPPELMGTPDGVAKLCEASSSVADLIRLATSPEYAAVRWQSGRAGNKGGSGTYHFI